jgi:hypothetical protein
MGIRGYIRAFRTTSLLVVVSLLVARPHMGLISGIGKFAALLVLTSLLMFVVARSADICRALAVRYMSNRTFLFSAVPNQEPVRQILTDGFNPAEPTLPSRFQLPPPPIAA